PGLRGGLLGAAAGLREVAAEAHGDLLGPRVADVPVGDRLEVARRLARGQVDVLRKLRGVGNGHSLILSMRPRRRAARHVAGPADSSPQMAGSAVRTTSSSLAIAS